VQAVIFPYVPFHFKLPDGSQAKSIANMYEHFVPCHFMPKKYAVLDTGASGLAVGVWRQFQLPTAATLNS